MQTKELLYKGNLSRKEFQISLPVKDGFDYVMWYELRDEDDDIFFVGPIVHYEVTGLAAFERPPLPSTNSSKVGGLELADPNRSVGN